MDTWHCIYGDPCTSTINFVDAESGFMSFVHPWQRFPANLWPSRLAVGNIEESIPLDGKD